jgi:HAE1 family hydrophobic/amphiphilic exporter-1
VLLGGLLVSTIFTLFLVPSLFTLTLEAKDALVRLLFGHGGEEAPEWEHEKLPAQETVTVRHAHDTHVLHPSLTPANGNGSTHSTSRAAVAVPPDDNGHANP